MNCNLAYKAGTKSLYHYKSSGSRWRV